MPRDLDASLMRVFAACARAGSISKAAATLGRSQPTISEQVRRLEDIVGAKLLVRVAKGVSLTTQGEALLPFAEAMLTLSDDAWRALGSEPEGTERLGIGILEDLWDADLATLLTRLGREHPGARIELVSLPGPELRRAIEQGRVQIALGDPSGIDLPVERTWRLAFQWTAAADLDLSAEPLPVVLCSAPCRWRARILATLDGAGTPWRVALESTNLTGVLGGVRAGMGVAALLAGDLGPDVRRIAPTPRMPPLPLAEVALQWVPAADTSAVAGDAIARLSALMDRRVDDRPQAAPTRQRSRVKATS